MQTVGQYPSPTCAKATGRTQGDTQCDRLLVGRERRFTPLAQSIRLGAASLTPYETLTPSSAI